MRFSLTPSSPLRRLFAAVLMLNVLLTTVGWVHAPCHAPAERHDVASVAVASVAVASHGVAAPMAAHGDMEGMCGPGGSCAAATHATPADEAPARGSGHDRHDSPAPGACALVAHCAAAIVVTTSTPAASDMVVAARPLASSDARPLEPSFQPDSPPPKG